MFNLYKYQKDKMKKMGIWGIDFLNSSASRIRISPKISKRIKIIIGKNLSILFFIIVNKESIKKIPKNDLNTKPEAKNDNLILSVSKLGNGPKRLESKFVK